MMFAYVDTSCLIAIAFQEPDYQHHASRLKNYQRLFSANLLEAEWRAAIKREEIEPKRVEDSLSSFSWILPERSLSQEIQIVLKAGYLRGADLWHVACALYLAGDSPGELVFETLDLKQRRMAAAVGFQVPSILLEPD